MTQRRSTWSAAAAGWLERHPYVLPAAVLLVGGVFRFYNLNWDDGHQLHPDERGIYMLVSGSGGNPPLSWPTSIAQFFQVQDPSGGSPLNPHYFAYGSLLYYVLAFVAGTVSFLGQHLQFLPGWTAADTYDGLPTVGRSLSAALTLFSVLLIFFLARRIFGYWTAVLAMTLSAFTVLDIQLAHFYQSDTLLLPLVLLTLLATVSVADGRRHRSYVLAGIGLGACLATKTTALLLVAPLASAALFAAVRAAPWPTQGAPLERVRRFYAAIARPLNRHLQWLLLSYLIAGAAFAVFEPYGILDRAKLLTDVAAQNSLLVTNNPPFGAPYTLQYAHTTPYLYQLKNMLFWTLGIPLALVAFGGVFFALVRACRLRLPPAAAVLLIWILSYFVVVGHFFAKFNRYMLPITPVMTLLGAAGLVWLVRWSAPRWKPVAGAAIVLVASGTLLYAVAYLNIYAHANTRVAASRWIYAHVPPGSGIAQEGPWDEGLPLDEGADTALGRYRFLNDTTNTPLLNPYAGELTQSDEQTKINDLTTVLTRADYIIMSSERMDRSVARVPDRLPVAYRYYQLLFDNRLNFRLVAHFQQHPRVGPITVEDYAADESFHVYDHPDVRIFRRVSSISPARAHRLLTTGLPTVASADPTGLPWILKPVLPAPDARLMLSSRQWQADQRGEALDEMFPPNGFAMQHPLLIWLLFLEVLGLVAFPITFVLFGRLLDRGWVISKTIGLVVTGYLVWITVSIRLSEYTRVLAILTAIVVGLLGVGLGLRLRGDIGRFVRYRWRYMLAGEAVFLAAFVLFALLRMWYPDLGHQFSPVAHDNLGAGRMGEKQMELAYLNAIARSRVFPPLDPFFAHGYINYYYFGFFLVSLLCKLTQIVPATGFNLAVATFGALLLGSIASVVLTLTRRVAPAVIAAAFVGVLGNLNGAWQVIRDLMAVGRIHSAFPATGGIVDALSGLQQVVFAHQTLPQLDFWESTRIFPSGSISEFPYFTYLFADLHPHLMAYPLTAAALALAVNLMRGGYSRWGQRGLALGLGGMLLGSIAATNPWDFPTYLLIVGIGAALAAPILRRRWSWSALLPPAGWLGGLAFLSLLFYLPFQQGYHTVFQSGIGLTRDISPDLLVNTGVCPDGGKVCPDAVHNALVTPLGLYLEHFGILLFAILSYVLLLVFVQLGLQRRFGRWLMRLQFALYYRERWRALLRARRAVVAMSPRSPAPDISLVLGAAVLVGGLLLFGYYLLGFLCAVLGVTVIVLTSRARRLHTSELFVLALVATGCVISVLTQIFFVKDFLAAGASFRMNTIFKFYDQVWILFAVSAACALYFFLDRQVARVRASARVPPLSFGEEDVVGHGQARVASPVVPTTSPRETTRHPRADRPEAPTGLGRVVHLVRRRPWWSAGMVALGLAGLVYTVGGTYSRETYRTTWLPESSVPLTLDGAAFMKVAYPGDFAGISWLDAHVAGSPVVAESGPSYYDWRSRVSMFTGLPGIINGIHEDEQRYSDELNPAELCSMSRSPDACVAASPSRADDLHALYDSASVADAWRIIHRYGVKYIFRGFAEEVCSKDQCYSRAGLHKFDRMVGHGLQIAFRTNGVTIFRVGGA